MNAIRTLAVAGAFVTLIWAAGYLASGGIGQ